MATPPAGLHGYRITNIGPPAYHISPLCLLFCGICVHRQINRASLLLLSSVGIKNIFTVNIIDRIPKRLLYMNLETTRPRGRPRNRWQDEVREYGRIVGGEEWQGRVYNREEWKKLLRTARNRRILHMPMEINK
jgi:hypothetical protein